MAKLQSNNSLNFNKEMIKKLKQEKEFWKKSYSKILDAYFELHKYRKLYDDQLSKSDKN
jgi:hypothetical protein